jgi:glycosyltransferase involved in cell wall biosynthesis
VKLWPPCGEWLGRHLVQSIQLCVLLASRNGEHVLPRTLEAYRCAMPPAVQWKLIVVDNGSTDRTPPARVDCGADFRRRHIGNSVSRVPTARSIALAMAAIGGTFGKVGLYTIRITCQVQNVGIFPARLRPKPT